MKHNEGPWELALIDLDGTLYRGERTLPGAPEFLQRLRNRGIRPVFFTNNSTRTPKQVCEKLASHQIRADFHEVCTSAQASAAHIRRRHGAGVTVLSIGQDGLREAIIEEGLTPLFVGGEESSRTGKADAAVLGLDANLSYQDLAVFCNEVMRLGEFILTNGDVRLPAEDRFLPGNGAVGSFVATATGLSPYVAGKPNPDFVEYALARYGVAPERTLVIGDNVETDVAVGKLAGLYTIQVTTGVQYLHESTSNQVRMTSHYTADEVHASVENLFRLPH